MRTFRSLFHRSDPGLRWDNIARTGVVTSIFLTPLVLLPWTADAWETHKILVLLVGLAVGWIGYFAGIMARRKVAAAWQPLDWLVAGVLCVTLLSAAVSVDPWMSWEGVAGAMGGSIVMVLMGVSLYFLTSRLATTPETRRVWWVGLASGVTTSLLLAVFQLSGMSLLPTAFSQVDFLNTISNNPVDVAIVAAALGAGAWLFASQAKIRVVQRLAAAVGIMSLVILAYFSQPIGWALFALGMITVVLVESRRGKAMQTRWIIMAVAIAAAGMVIQLSGVATRGSTFRPNDVRLDAATSQSITWNTLRHRPILGSGPSTWLHDFVAYRPVSFNSSPWWANRFIRSRTAWTETLATLGVLGFLAWLAVLIAGMRLAWRTWAANPTNEHLWMVFILAATVLLGLVAPWSIVWLTGVWTVLGLVRASRDPDQPKPIGVGAPLAFAVTILALAVIGYSQGQDYASQVLTQRGQIAILRGRPLAEAQPMLESARSLNPRNIAAASLLSTVYAAQAELAVQKQDSGSANTWVQKAVATMEQAIARNPKHPVAYEEMNNVLNRLAGIVIDADERARQYFDILRQLEPANPIHDVGYGQTAMVTRARLLAGPTVTDETKKQADRLRQSALAAYAEALRKKPDYVQAQFARAQALIAVGKYSEALTDLEHIRRSAESVPAFWIQYGTALSKLDRTAEAVQAFEQAVTLAPNDPNTYLSLAEHYRAHNDVAKAKSTLEGGLKAIPGDASLKQKLAELSR